MQSTTWQQGLMLLVMMALSACAQTPALAPPPTPGLWIGKMRANIEIRQDDHTIMPDAHGVYHLKPGPFGVHVIGDINHVGLLASTEDTLAKALADTKQPVILLGATGAAYSAGDLIINDKARLAGWDEFKPIMGDQYAAMGKNIQEKLGEMPLLVDSTFQPVDNFAPDDSRDYVFPVYHLLQADESLIVIADKDGKFPPTPRPKELNWAGLKMMNITLLIENDIPNQMFYKVMWRLVHIQFDAK